LASTRLAHAAFIAQQSEQRRGDVAISLRAKSGNNVLLSGAVGDRPDGDPAQLIFGAVLAGRRRHAS